MGAINQAFNQATGAVAGAALAIKHAKETEFSKAITAENAAVIARNQAREAEVAADAAKIGEKKTNDDYVDSIINVWGRDDEYYKAQEDYEKNKQKRKNASHKKVDKKLEEWQAAEIARDTLGNKVYSIETMKERAAEQRAHADKATQLAEKAQQDYQSRWGGIK